MKPIAWLIPPFEDAVRIAANHGGDSDSRVQPPGIIRVSLRSVQSSTPSMVGTEVVVVVSVRPLLGENQTNSFRPWPFVPADSSISEPNFWSR